MILRMPWVRSEIAALEARAAILSGNLRKAEKTGPGGRQDQHHVYHRCGPTAARGGRTTDRATPQRSQQLLAAALDSLVEVSAEHLVAACRYRLGTLLATSEGNELVGRAENWFSNQRIADLDPFLRLLAPFPS